MPEIAVPITLDSAEYAVSIDTDAGFKNKAYIALAADVLTLPVVGTSTDSELSAMQKSVRAVGNVVMKSTKKMYTMLFNPQMLGGHELSGSGNGGVPEYKGKLMLQNNENNRGIIKALRNQHAAIILNERNQSAKQILCGFTEGGLDYWAKFDEFEDSKGVQVGDEMFIKLGFTFRNAFPAHYTGTLQLTPAS